MPKTKKPKKVTPKLLFKKILPHLLPAILSLILLILILITYQVVIADKYYPVTLIGDTNISFLTQGQAISAFQSKFDQRATSKLQFNSKQGTFSIDLATASANLDYTVFDSGLKKNRGGSFFNQLTLEMRALFSTYRITPKITLSLDKQLESIDLAINQPPQNALLSFNETATPSSSIQIKEGQNGLMLDRQALKNNITNYLLFGKYNDLLPVKEVPPAVTTEKITKAKVALEQTTANPIKLSFEDKTWTIDAKQLLTLLNLDKPGEELLDKNQTYSYLENVALEIDQDVHEGLFKFDESTKRVSAFQPSQDGRKLDLDKTYQALLDAVNNQASKNISLPVAVVKAKSATSDVNSLGIKELVGKGISNFAHSIENRIYNVNLGAEKINGVLVPPGETFSFDQTVGDITAATGFKQAYVIKSGRTVLDDGGGICQVSTTLFRAVLNAGLPVVARTAHAYRVGYYEQGFPPGLDATVFYPSVDFKFKNDTANYILIQAYTDGLTLYVDLYGTSDGRVATLSTPVVTGQTPPPPDLRQDDPTLLVGTVKQVDFSAWGANVSFNRTVVRGGQTLIQETFRSAYKPWQAVYLVGTKT